MEGFFNWVAQAGAVTWLNLKNLPQRLGTSIATVVGVAGVVLVFVGVLSMAVGFQRTLSSTGGDDTSIVLRAGSTGEMGSGLQTEETRIIADAPGVGRGERGRLSSAEVFVIVDVPKRSSGTDANVPLRGVQAEAFEVRDDFEIVEGRRFEFGRNEIIVGQNALLEFAGLELGTVRRWGQSEWTVVGIFSTGGSVEDSEIWCDAKVLQPAYRLENFYNSVHVKLDSARAFTEFKDALTADPRLNVEVFRESEFYAEQSRVMATIIRVLGYLIASLMAVGAVFGALNTMYTAVSARTREIATLRALGFGSGPVMVSVLVESLLLAMVGGFIGAAIAYLMFNGFTAATMNFQNFSQVAFAFAVTPQLLGQGALFALGMGLVGGFFPAFRAARLPVSTALRRL